MPLRRKAAIAGAAEDELDTKLLLQIFDAGGQGWLRDAEMISGPAEMPDLGDSDEHFQLVDHGDSL